MTIQYFTKIFVVVTMLGLSQFCLAQSVTINPNSSTAIVDAQSTTKGVLAPRMTVAQRNLIPLSAGLQVYCTNCTPAGPYSYNGSAWLAMFQTNIASPITYTIGQAAQGGIVFWIDETGQHGLVAATADQSASTPWYNGNTNTKAIRTGVYGGAFNTEQINNGFGYGSYAAIIAAQYTGGQYGDWYLPALNELNLMYAKRVAIGGLAGVPYWSSTEVSTSQGLVAQGAYQINFSTGLSTFSLKANSLRVRAIRKF
jgi:hypothetical protein